MMKKLFLATLAAVAVLSGLNTDAHAVKLRRENLVWRHSGTDFNKLQVSSTFACTTQVISMNDWVLPNYGTLAAAVDSMCIGQLVVVGDSSAAYTPNLTVLTYSIQASEDGSNWQVVFAPGSQTVTSGNHMFGIPLWIRTSPVSNVALNSRIPFPLFGGKLRIVVTGATGALNAARPYLIRFTD